MRVDIIQVISANLFIFKLYLTCRLLIIINKAASSTIASSKGKCDVLFLKWRNINFFLSIKI